MIRRCCAPQVLLQRWNLPSKAMVLVRCAAVPLQESRRYFPSHATHTMRRYYATHNNPKDPVQRISSIKPKPTAAISGGTALDWKADLSKRMKMKALTDACADPTLIYLAACRILNAPNLQGDTDKKYIEEYIDAQKWSDAAIFILDYERADEEVTRINKFMKAELDTNIFPGLLELFTKAELHYMLSGDRVVTSLDAAENQALLKKKQNRLQTCNEFRQRVLQLGLTRFREWLEHESQGTDPYTLDTKQKKGCPVPRGRDLASCKTALRQLGKDVSKLTTATEFLEVWQKVARPTSVDRVIIHDKYKYRNAYALMRETSLDLIKTREASVDDTLVDAVASAFSASMMNTFTTLAMSGEAGCGKTQSALALATRDDVLCVYMRAQEVFSHFEEATKMNPEAQGLSSTELRNQRWASSIVDELVILDSSLGLPMTAAPEIRKRLVIIGG